MKTIYIISVLISFMGLFAMGQTPTIQTPWGSTVSVWTQEDMDPEHRYLMDQLYSDYVDEGAVLLQTLPGDNNYPDVSSTLKFNCHGYAWYMYWLDPDDQFDAPWQINDTEADNYFNDPSFVECTAAEADILWISNGAHSALTTDDPDDLLSKWGDGPLAVHGKDQGESPWPITPSTTVTYYKKCLYEVTGEVDADDYLELCGVKFNNTSVLNYVDLEIEYEEGVVIEGAFTTGTGATLYLHPD